MPARTDIVGALGEAIAQSHPVRQNCLRDFWGAKTAPFFTSDTVAFPEKNIRLCPRSEIPVRHRAGLFEFENVNNNLDRFGGR